MICNVTPMYAFQRTFCSHKINAKYFIHYTLAFMGIASFTYFFLFMWAMSQAVVLVTGYLTYTR